MAPGFFKSRGQLIAVDPRGLNDFYKDLKSAFGKYVATAHTVSKWVNLNGGGMYTTASKNAGVATIKSIIDGDIEVGKNWPPLSKEHIDSREGLATYDKMWKFRGNVYQNIIARKSGKGYEIGIDRRKMVTPTGFSTHAGTARLAQKIPIERYAGWVEYGTKWMPPRPLFSLAAVYFSQTIAPALHKIVKKSVQRVANKYIIEKVRGKYDNAPMAGGISQGSMEMANANPDSDFSSEVMNDLFLRSSMGEGGISLTKHVGEKGMSQVSTFDAADRKELKKTLNGLTGKDLDWLAEHAAELKMDD